MDIEHVDGEVVGREVHRAEELPDPDSERDVQPELGAEVDERVLKYQDQIQLPILFLTVFVVTGL